MSEKKTGIRNMCAHFPYCRHRHRSFSLLCRKTCSDFGWFSSQLICLQRLFDILCNKKAFFFLFAFSIIQKSICLFLVWFCFRKNGREYACERMKNEHSTGAHKRIRNCHITYTKYEKRYKRSNFFVFCFGCGEMQNDEKQ